MGPAQRRNLHRFEGRTVSIALADGSRLDDVALVSARRSTLWVFLNGEDTFVPVGSVIDVWESSPARSAA